MKKGNKEYSLPPINRKGKEYTVPSTLITEYQSWKERFKWTIIHGEYIPQKSCRTEPFIKFLEHTIHALNEYERRSWKQVLQEKNNHPVKPEQKLEAEQQIKHKLQIIKKDVEIYQLKGNTLSHRIFGYRENGIFHVMLNDLHHKQSK